MYIEELTIIDLYRICIQGCDVCPFCKAQHDNPSHKEKLKLNKLCKMGTLSVELKDMEEVRPFTLEERIER